MKLRLTEVEVGGKIDQNNVLDSINKPILDSEVGVTCENIRFSSLFVAASTATKSEEKRMFSQAKVGAASFQCD